MLPLASLDEAKASVARILASYLQPLALEVVSADALPPDFAASTAKLPGGRAVAAPATAGAPSGPGPARCCWRASAATAPPSTARSREVTAANPGAVPQVLRDEAAEALYEHLAE